VLLGSDYKATQDLQFLQDVWPAVLQAMAYLRHFTGVGEMQDMVLNEGYPDQTYDTWEVRECSAYCGGIWIAALRYANSRLLRCGYCANARWW
jgi:non-lysosomal glucosylceramidase